MQRPMDYPDARILVFTKPPIPGRCKTRLAHRYGPVRAARIHRQLAGQTLAMLENARVAPFEIHASDGTDHPWFLQQCRRYDCPLVRQSNGNLGRRMFRAARKTLQAAPACLIVGTDCTVLDAGHLRKTLRELDDGQDATLLPSEDGGYALIGLRIAEPLLFRNIDWGTAAVMRQTRQRLRRSGLRWTELEPVWDVDEAADYRRARRLGLL